MVIDTQLQYNITLGLNEQQLNSLLDEIEGVFAHYLKEDQLQRILNLIEFKNMLTLSVNNATS